MIADRILQLDYMTPRARDVRGWGPGALTADADKMGIPVAEAAPPDGRKRSPSSFLSFAARR